MAAGKGRQLRSMTQAEVTAYALREMARKLLMQAAALEASVEDCGPPPKSVKLVDPRKKQHA